MSMPPGPKTVATASPIPEAPEIDDNESFGELARKLSYYIIEAVETPLGWEDLRAREHIQRLQPLIDRLAGEVHHAAIVAVLLALKGHFVAIESDDDSGINESRGLACELVAWQFVLSLSDRDALDLLLFELHSPEDGCEGDEDGDEEEAPRQHAHSVPNGAGERTALLARDENGNGNGNGHASSTSGPYKPGSDDGFAEPFLNLSTLEIAAIVRAKKFLSQRAVQDMITGIWSGEVVFWESLTVQATKKPAFYNPRLGDPWCRIRVPRYMKTFELLFFLCFLALFYVVSAQRSLWAVTVWEVLFYVYAAGFALDQWNTLVESGARLYSADIWSLWDVGIILIGLAFFVLRAVGLATGRAGVLDAAFSVLALHSLFLTPRIFSLLSLSPYYGSMLPGLKEMAKQFLRFLGFVLIIYVGFFTTFVLLARGHFSLQTMSITILKVFFGAGVVGFDIAPQISPYLGLPVMVVFVCLTNQLLITSMMAHISNSLRTVLDSSREEYLYVYSVYVLEASTSNKLTYFFTPFNLVPIFFKPLFWCIPYASARRVRIFLLKATHAPMVGLIWAYERFEAWYTAREAEEHGSMEFGSDTLAGNGVTGGLTSGTALNLNGGPNGRRAQRVPTLDTVTHNASGGGGGGGGGGDGGRYAGPRKQYTLMSPSSRKVVVPASLVQRAHSKGGHSARGQRQQKQYEQQQQQQQQQQGRTDTGAATSSPDKTATPVPASAGAGAGATAGPSDQGEMMKMLKELSAQVEELRATVVKQAQGPEKI